MDFIASNNDLFLKQSGKFEVMVNSSGVIAAKDG